MPEKPTKISSEGLLKEIIVAKNHNVGALKKKIAKVHICIQSTYISVLAYYLLSILQFSKNQTYVVITLGI